MKKRLSLCIPAVALTLAAVSPVAEATAPNTNNEWVPQASNAALAEQSESQAMTMMAATKSKQRTNAVSYATKLSFNPKKHTITTYFTIKKITGKAPQKFYFNLNLRTSTKKNGKTKSFATMKDSLTTKEIKAKRTITRTYKVKSTKFWRYRLVTKSYWSRYASTPSRTTWSASVLANKKAQPYPIFYNRYTKEKMSVPNSASYKKLAKKKQIKPGNYRNNFIKYHDRKFGRANWKGVSVFHMLPLAYGGNNHMNNLYALPTGLYKTHVASWWKGY
ncbi:hypothetical protein [Fictibacillus macauensis]|uniref:hypothetical protein n=1 Tax=Fictibacillus macauensis TaxID=245160 RepID=UPI000300E760|nr:hypothetical protein [Fictibacillus macauensis]